MHPLTEKETLVPYRHRSKRAVLLALAAVAVIAAVILASAIPPVPGRNERPPASSDTTKSRTTITTTVPTKMTTTLDLPTPEPMATAPTTTTRSSTASKTTLSAPTTSTTAKKPTTTTTKSTTTTTRPTTSTVPVSPFEVSEVDGGVEIVGINVTPTDGVCVLPSVIDGQPVVRIGDRAFKDNHTLTSVTIPAAVRSIGLNAFMNCSKLSSVYIRATSIDIHTYAFSSRYQRDVELTIYAPASALNARTASVYWDADYVEWNG